MTFREPDADVQSEKLNVEVPIAILEDTSTGVVNARESNLEDWLDDFLDKSVS